MHRDMIPLFDRQNQFSGLLVNLVLSLIDDHDQKALLATTMCNESKVRMHELMRMCFESGFNIKCHDLVVVPRKGIMHLESFKPRTKSTPITDAELDSESEDHEATLVDIAGDEFVFDLTSAQYGHFRSVTPYAPYRTIIVSRRTRKKTDSPELPVV